MSAVVAVPEVMTSAATDLATIVSSLDAAHAVAAPPTSAVLSAARDEVSTGVAHLFSQYARDYQTLAGQATAFHDQFVRHLTASANAYTAAEATNVASLQPFSAIADSIGGAVGGLPAQAANLLNGVQSQLLNLYNRIYGVLLKLLSTVVVLFVAILIIAFVAAVILMNTFNSSPTE
ncbi:PE family protein [Mycobacterium terramassiliense]|uniref:PE family protein n=1 Tax=Mycobacterium terramassiliense TaxID=1841859 RepID=A0A2U3NI85_9MYCO|nr:PE family protein [Mycobacterium terramassiliense]SPM31135.1 PE family protein [Mycobacterium terramassiliense]